MRSATMEKMDLQKFVDGERVELPQMLDARDQRVRMQREQIEKYGTPLVCFTLNIAGPVKVFPLAVRTYEEGLRLLRCQCKADGLPVVGVAEKRGPTGYACFLSVNAPAGKVKRVLCKLEQASLLGRLFDIDVLDVDGRKVSRSDIGWPARTCLLCEKPAYLCSRSREHSVEEILKRSCEIMWDYFAENYAASVASIAARALLHEALATPKPGLVDRNNSGAHHDMDLSTFETSSLTLLPYFQAFVSYGIGHCRAASETMLPEIRSIGIRAETAMFRATGGANTHKGLIFSLGILCTALGCLYGMQAAYSRSALREKCRELSAPLAHDFQDLTEETSTTNGERLYLQFGIRGVRGEAISGFPTLFTVALPRFSDLCAKGFSMNDSAVLTLLQIVANLEDTNIINRSSYGTMRKIQKDFRSLILDRIEDKDYRKVLEELDAEFTRKNISPGGSADVLAMTYFISFLEKEMEGNPDLRVLPRENPESGV